MGMILTQFFSNDLSRIEIVSIHSFDLNSGPIGIANRPWPFYFLVFWVNDCIIFEWRRESQSIRVGRLFGKKIVLGIWVFFMKHVFLVRMARSYEGKIENNPAGQWFLLQFKKVDFIQKVLNQPSTYIKYWFRSSSNQNLQPCYACKKVPRYQTTLTSSYYYLFSFCPNKIIRI